MQANKYQNLAMRTANAEKMSQKDLLTNGALGLCGETGEVSDIIKKHLFQGHKLDTEKVIDELGDVLWYISLITSALGRELDEVMEHNILKLKKRYPQGFEVERSVRRDE